MILAFIGNRNQRVFVLLDDILFSQIGYFKLFTLLYVLSSAYKYQLCYSTHLPSKKKKKKGYWNFLRVCVKSIEQFEENYLFFILNLPIREYYSVQVSHSVVSDSATPWTAAHQASLSITNCRHLLKLMSIESVMPSNHMIYNCLPFKNSVSNVLYYSLYRAVYTLIKYILKYLISFEYYFKWNYV